MKSIIDDIFLNYDERRIGSWSGQNEDVLFYAKDGNAVITKKSKEFVTVMKGGVFCAGFKNARKK